MLFPRCPELPHRPALPRADRRLRPAAPRSSGRWHRARQGHAGQPRPARRLGPDTSAHSAPKRWMHVYTCAHTWVGRVGEDGKLLAGSGNFSEGSERSQLSKQRAFRALSLPRAMLSPSLSARQPCVGTAGGWPRGCLLGFWGFVFYTFLKNWFKEWGNVCVGRVPPLFLHAWWSFLWIGPERCSRQSAVLFILEICQQGKKCRFVVFSFYRKRGKRELVVFRRAGVWLKTAEPIFL